MEDVFLYMLLFNYVLWEKQMMLQLLKVKIISRLSSSFILGGMLLGKLRYTRKVDGHENQINKERE